MASVQACPVSGPKSWLKMEAWSPEINVPSKCVTGSAVMPDGRLILADNANQQIILLDKDFAMQSTLALPGKPWDVAMYGDNDAVVTLPDIDQLQYIHVDALLWTGLNISTELPCWGVAFHAGEIYVGVPGGNVQVLDKRGTVTRRIGVDVHGIGRYMCPNYITVGTGGTVYQSYISASEDSTITCRTNVGDVVYEVQHGCGRGGILADEEGNLLVCCSESIEVLGKDGARHRVILSSADGVRYPQSVSYRRSDQTLIVTMSNTPSCRAYKLK